MGFRKEEEAIEEEWVSAMKEKRGRRVWMKQQWRRKQWFYEQHVFLPNYPQLKTCASHIGTNSISFLTTVRIRFYFALFLKILGPINQKKLKDQNLIYSKI